MNKSYPLGSQDKNLYYCQHQRIPNKIIMSESGRRKRSTAQPASYKQFSETGNKQISEDEEENGRHEDTSRSRSVDSSGSAETGATERTGRSRSSPSTTDDEVSISNKGNPYKHDQSYRSDTENEYAEIAIQNMSKISKNIQTCMTMVEKS